MIDMTVTGADSVADRIGRLGPTIDGAVAAAAGKLLERLRDLADRNLSGAVLKPRTGTLRASLSGSVIQANGISATLSANTPYAAFQENGFHGTEQVRAYLRQQSQAFGRPMPPKVVTVRPHGRRVDYAGRPFLRAALNALAPDIRSDLADAVSDALHA